MNHKPMKGQRRYLSYLLRLWRENSGSLQIWRATLERPQDGERLVFASLVELFAFLAEETESGVPAPEPPAEAGEVPGDELNAQA
jgi:hypothetical protein